MPIEKDKVYWFPMRVSYGRELKVKEFLEKHNFETYLPMTTEISKDGHSIIKKKVPAIKNFIFIHDTMERITEIKQTKEEAEPLRYLIHRPLDAEHKPNEIITVPEKQMNDFIKVSSGPEDQITFMSYNDLEKSPKGKVKIVNGEFHGVEGTLKRIKGNKKVVIELEGIGGIIIKFIPKEYYIQKT